MGDLGADRAARHVANATNRHQARLERQWQQELVHSAQGADRTFDPNTLMGRANSLSTNIMIQTLNVANAYALVPMQNEINDLADLQNVITNVQSSLNTMSNFLSNVVGSPLSGQQYQNQFNSFVSSYDDLFLANQPGNSANTLGDLNFYVRVKDPSNGQVVTVAVPADSPEMEPYWQKFQDSMPVLKGPNGQDYFGGTSKNQMFISGPQNANEAVSGVQYYVARKIQTVLDQQSPMDPTNPNHPFLFTPDGVANELVYELENGTPKITKDGKTVKKASPPLYTPSMTGSNDAVVTQLWNVFNDVPEVPATGANPYPGGVAGPPYTPTDPPNPPLPGDAAGNPISMQEALLTGNTSAIQQNVVVWQYIAQQKEATSPAEWFTQAGNPLETYQQNINDATNSLSSISTSMINQIQMISSELQIIDNIVSKMISSFTGMTNAIVRNYRSG